MTERYDIAIKSPVRKLFVYESDEVLEPGCRVRLPFRSSERIGIVWGKSQSDFPDPKKVKERIDQQALFDAAALRFYEHAALYYGLPLGELLSASVPKKVREGGALAEPQQKNFQPQLVPLTPEQERVKKNIAGESGYSAHLLFGETGSGKTEVYLHLLAPLLKEGGQVLFLVPEISLTPQLESRLSERVGAGISSFHSHLSEKKRWESFSQARSGQADLFLGARSALFLPYQNLKLIIVDEEHDSSYKQSERMLYHARDLALLRASQLKIPIVLGSATPSLESYRLMKEKKLTRHDLKRYQAPKNWKIELIDLKKEWKEGPRSYISQPLHQAIEENLSKSEQSLLFLNRRGSASHRVCTACGHSEGCPNCSTQLTLHFDLGLGVCHMCDFRRPLQKTCGGCGSNEFFQGGIGTKEVSVQIQERFPEARVERLDRDVTQSRKALPRILKAFTSGEIDILVGTQMISKGLDVANLSLVGVILADQGWGVPDFRAMERSFQLLKQILGRAGRRGQDSRCLIQTLSPEHELFSYLEEDRTEEFLEAELKIRELAGLPPWSRAILWTLSHRDEQKLGQAARALAKRLELVTKDLEIQLLGPVPAPLQKLKGEYRMQLLAKAPIKLSLTPFLQAVMSDIEERPLGVKWRVERDPYHFM